MNRPKLLALLPSYHSANPPYPVGGGEISNRLLLEGLVSRGWQVDVVAINTDLSEGSGGVTVHKPTPYGSEMVTKLLGYHSLKNLSTVVAKKVKPDVIVCGPTALSYAKAISDACGARCGLIVRAFENFEFLVEGRRQRSGIKRKVGRWLIGSYQANEKPADFYVFNSVFMRDKILPFINSPSYVVYPSIDIEQQEKSNFFVKNINMVGMTEEKGFNLFKELAARFPKLTFSVYGKKSKFIEEDHLPANIHYKGWADITEIYGSADVFLVPSQSEEAFGRVSIEALAFGCIVLVSDKGGLPETVNFDQRFIVKSDDLEAWCEALAQVLGNTEFYARSIKDVADSISKYSTEIQTRQFEVLLLEEIVNR